MSRTTCILVCAALAPCVWAQDAGIGDPAFPTLGNRGYLAGHYALKLTFDPSTDAMDADVTMSGVATSRLSEISLDFTGFTIRSVTLNGHPVKFRRSIGKLYVKTGLGSGEKFTLETCYSGKPVQTQSAALPAGMKSGWIPYLGGAVAACEPDLAHTWFPCNDHPLDKATFDFQLTTPRPNVAIANGKRVQSTGTNYRFSLDKPTLTCMATAVFGQFTAVSGPSAQGVPITSYVAKGVSQAARDRLKLLPKYMKILTDRLGPYPFDTYGAVLLPTALAQSNELMAGSALETTTLPLFGPFTEAAPAILIHELSHQWMGNCVSVTHWGDDIWWVEGFAQYAEWLLVESEHGREAYENEVASAYSQATAQTHWLKPGHLPTEDLFSMRSYIGGALTFHALRRTVGDVQFNQILRQFVEKHRYGNASAKDWIAISSQIAKRDMSPFFNAWLYGDKNPPLPR
ncbi:MAG: M1 family metallopeptidase [Fimbriimonas sp.]|nr:M1 family metallopeptidase [Fimbriimonas sp.]